MRGKGSFELVAITPVAWNDPSIAIAASRAGELGVLDLSSTPDGAAANAVVAKLNDFAARPWGLRIRAAQAEFAFKICEQTRGRLSDLVIATDSLPPPDLLASISSRGKRHGCRIVIEIRSADEIELAHSLGADVLLIKGNESGGWVAAETTFVLLQKVLAATRLPVWAQGGIGLHTAAACFAAGAAGVVLDAQLWLTRESSLPRRVRQVLSRMDGSETLLLKNAVRIFNARGAKLVTEAARVAEQVTGERGSREWRDWQAWLDSKVGWGSQDENIWMLGQDAAFAAGFAERYGTVAGVLAGIRDSIRDHIRLAQSLNPLGEGSPLALSHRTRFPIVQGPMTRVSDGPRFAKSVADAGALPFLALALMRQSEVEALLRSTVSSLGNRPWGVGVLGFVPEELRREQLAAIAQMPPPFALIAGGRPEQVRALEEQGITTYVHVPSPGLLRMFLKDGATRFVFEGRECGGHVGPRSSFVLWEQMIGVLLEHVAESAHADNLHILFAGGIHDSLSAAMVAALSASLAEKGIRVGTLLGTAYLFTEEAVASGAIVEGFQTVALECTRTSLIETGPGHLVRCANTPYVEAFDRQRRLLLNQGLSPHEVREKLEELNLGRLRIAAKGVTRADTNDGERKFRSVSPDEQHLEGLYMLGEIAALRNRRVTMTELHEDIAIAGSRRLRELPTEAPQVIADRREKPLDIAIIGMACLFPKAHDLCTYWENILDKVDCISEIPVERFDWTRYYDSDRHARDRIYSRWGGFLDPVLFDPIRYGMPPNSISSIEPVQLLTLRVVEAALDDAGYGKRPFNRARTSVVLGAGGGIADLGQQYAFRSALPMYVDGICASHLPQLPEWTEDSFAGILLNVAAGRVANRLDLGGANYVVDAACASSLAAVYLAARELESGVADMVITGGVDTVQNPFSYLCFAKTQALSPTGRCRAFDENADGIVISEGLAVVVLKRLADAERDGDRIYAVIKGIGASSDGRDKGLTAPRPEGQMLALERAYHKAGFLPSTVGLIEAHGTGTVAGDQAEVASLTRVFAAAGAAPQSCALGSVKSMIGHTKCAAGVAGLIKAALALDRKILPPTLHVQKPNPKADFPNSPFYVNSETRPWLSHGDHPRRAGVSAFGFGGTNFHAVLEEYTGRFLASPTPRRERWPTELMIWIGEGREETIAQLRSLRNQLEAGANPPLADLSFALWEQARPRLEEAQKNSFRVALLAASSSDLRDKIDAALAVLSTTDNERAGLRDVYWNALPSDFVRPKLALLFPGQGSQYPDMLKDLAVQFEDIRDVLEKADRALAGSFPRPLSSFIYPTPRFSREAENRAAAELTDTRVAQPALGALEIGIVRLLRRCGISPDATAGHSYGEYAALCAAGAISEQFLFAVSEARGRFIASQSQDSDGAMAAVSCSAEVAEEILHGVSDVWVANRNSPQQTILSGSEQRLGEVRSLFEARKIGFHPIAVSCAFHSPLVAQAKDALARFLESVDIEIPRIPVYSNTTADRYPEDAGEIRRILAEQLAHPVEFQSEIEAMYQAGIRIFLEVGPRSVLTTLVTQILVGRPHLALSCDAGHRPGLTQLQHVLAQLAVAGVDINLDPLFESRTVRLLSLEKLPQSEPVPRHAWMITGGKARPVSDGEIEREPPAPLRLQRIGETSPIPIDATVPGDALEKIPSVPDIQGGSDRVVLQFQQLMQQFLQTQQTVMSAYLNSQAGTRAVVPVEKTPPAEPERMPSAEAAAAVQAPAAAQVPAAADSSPAEAMDSDALRRLVLQVVSDRTGYPPEVLQWDADLEGDLGIDSIKRIEIVGELERATGQDGSARRSGLVEAKTLRGLAEALVSAGTASATPTDLGAASITPTEPSPAPTVPTIAKQVPRFTLRTVAAPATPSGPELLAGKRFLVTDDGGGVAAAFCKSLAELGATPILIERLMEDSTDIQDLVARVRREQGPIHGIVHLQPLAAAGESSSPPASLVHKVRADVKTLFTLVRAASSDLINGGWVLVATHTRGRALEGGMWVASSGVAGFLKTLSLEWESALCRSVVFGSEDEADAISSALIEELLIRDSSSEVARIGGIRTKPQPHSSPFLEENLSALRLDSESVILVIGGARGITAEVAVELAQRYAPTLVLIGRTGLPEGGEPTETAGIEDPRFLKSALVNRARRAGIDPSPAAIEAEYKQLLRKREVLRNIERMRAAGSRVELLQTDVCDEAALSARIEQVYNTYGRLDGVIHGAGIIEDKLVEQKEVASFDRVFETKIAPIGALLTSIRPESLHFLILFSSVSGLFGNRGQGDYAAANASLNELALEIDRLWPGRVLSLNWGPWDAGLASPEVRRRFAERGLQIIEPQEGARAFIRELESARKGDPIVILGDGPWKDPTPSSLQASRPLLRLEAPKIVAQNGFCQARLRLDGERHLYLRDHLLDGRPVLPAAMALEILAEFVEQQTGMVIAGADDFRVLRGVIVGNGGCEVTVRMNHKPDEGEPAKITAEILDRAASQPLYRASIILAHSPALPAYHALDLGTLSRFRFSVRESYERWLFHGPCFQAIETIEGINDQGLVAQVRPVPPSQCLLNGAGEWLTEPILIDAAFQLAILWVREHADLTPLPARFKSYRRYGTPSGPIRCEVAAELRDTSLLRTQIIMRSLDSSFVSIFEDMDFTCSRELNRLAAKPMTEVMQ